MSCPKTMCAMAVMLSLAPAAMAEPLVVLQYDMPNGGGQASGGSLNYWDRNYTGSGSTTTDGAPLSGGVGKLVDGVVSTQVWNLVSNNEGTGDYVGWWIGTTPNPTITFSFAAGTTVDGITVYLDNSQFGGVFAPQSIVIDGIARDFVAPAAGTVGPVSFDGLALSGGTHTIQFVQAPASWTFVSEVVFDGSVVPEPGSLVLMTAGLAWLAGFATRRLRISPA